MTALDQAWINLGFSLSLLFAALAIFWRTAKP
jgi:hypothetical protein